MSVIESDLKRWSTKKWGWVIAAAALLQGGAAAWFSAGGPIARVVHPVPPRVRLVLVQGANLTGVARDLIDDPMLFARANPHGFSSMAWSPPRRPIQLLDQPKGIPLLSFEDARSLLGNPR